MGVPLKAILSGIRLAGRAIPTLERKVSGFVGRRAWGATDAIKGSDYTINSWLKQFGGPSAGEAAFENHGIASMIPRAAMRPADLKFRNGRTYYAGNDVTAKWDSKQFTFPKDPNASTKFGPIPWWKADPTYNGPNPTIGKQTRAALHQAGKKLGIKKYQNYSDSIVAPVSEPPFGEAEIAHGREVLGATALGGAAVRAISNLRDTYEQEED